MAAMTPGQYEMPQDVPFPDADIFDAISLLEPDEQAVLHEIRGYLQQHMRHQIVEYWNREAFPFEMLSALADLGLGQLGGNGTGSDYEAAKIFNDAEVIHTYEGTYEINSLIVSRAVTGVSAFV